MCAGSMVEFQIMLSSWTDAEFHAAYAPGDKWTTRLWRVGANIAE